MWDDSWFGSHSGVFVSHSTGDTGTVFTYDDAAHLWRRALEDNGAPKDVPKPVDDAQARKLKVARFAHVPADCLEIKTETREA